MNGDPGLVLSSPEGAVWVAAFEIADGLVVAVRSILNPDKLAHVARADDKQRRSPT